MFRMQLSHQCTHAERLRLGGGRPQVMIYRALARFFFQFTTQPHQPSGQRRATSYRSGIIIRLPSRRGLPRPVAGLRGQIEAHGPAVFTEVGARPGSIRERSGTISGLFEQYPTVYIVCHFVLGHQAVSCRGEQKQAKGKLSSIKRHRGNLNERSKPSYRAQPAHTQHNRFGDRDAASRSVLAIVRSNCALACQVAKVPSGRSS